MGDRKLPIKDSDLDKDPEFLRVHVTDLKEEIAQLKAEAEKDASHRRTLMDEIYKLQGENAQLKAEVERLRRSEEDEIASAVHLAKIQKTAMESKLAQAVAALERIAIQVTPEEYEAECGDELDDTSATEAYEAMILEARAAMAELKRRANGQV